MNSDITRPPSAIQRDEPDAAGAARTVEVREPHRLTDPAHSRRCLRVAAIRR